jgi:hypothetical protein
MDHCDVFAVGIFSTAQTPRAWATPTRQFPQHIDCKKHILPLAVELSDLEADNELSVMHCLRQVDTAVIVDCAEQALGGVVGILVVWRVLKRKKGQVTVCR